MAGTSNIAPVAAAGAGSHKHKFVASAADPALASRFGNISKLSVPLPVLGIAEAIVIALLFPKSPEAGA